MTCLFMHVLKYPQLSSTESDVALLELGAGHFRWVEFSTIYEKDWLFMKETARWAAMALERYQLRRINNKVCPTSCFYLDALSA